MSGLFITFEGTEGSGKSTQLSLLAERLRARGHKVITLREPGGTPIGEEIRHTLKHSHANHAMTPETELLLLAASRAQLVREVICPALEAGAIVLCDRFFDSTIAYQAYGRKLDFNIVKSIIEVAVGKTRPNLTILLHVSSGISRERMEKRSSRTPAVRDRFEEADQDFFDRVAAGYEKLAAAEPHRVKRVDAERTPEEVSAAIWQMVEEVLK